LLGRRRFQKANLRLQCRAHRQCGTLLGLGRHAYNFAREHALVRNQFGRPLCEFQGVQWKFAEMAVKLDAAQLLLYRAIAERQRWPAFGL
jgi:alkylation response protein AidB-like acyl-CoA dehydrogenase